MKNLLFLLLFPVGVFSQNVQQVEPLLIPIALTKEASNPVDVIKPLIVLNASEIGVIHIHRNPSNDSSVTALKKLDIASLETLDSVNILDGHPRYRSIYSMLRHQDSLVLLSAYPSDFSIYHTGGVAILRSTNDFDIVSTVEMDVPDSTQNMQEISPFINSVGNIVSIGLNTPLPIFPPTNVDLYAYEFTLQGELIRRTYLPISPHSLGAMLQVSESRYGIMAGPSVGIVDENFDLDYVVDVREGNNEACTQLNKAVSVGLGASSFFGFGCFKAEIVPGQGNPVIKRYDKAARLNGTTGDWDIIADILVEIDSSYEVRRTEETLALQGKHLYFGNNYQTYTTDLSVPRTMFTVNKIDTAGATEWVRYYWSEGDAVAKQFLALPNGKLLVLVEKNYYSDEFLPKLIDRDYYGLLLNSDGTVSSSEPVNWNLDRAAAVQLYPNPTSGFVAVETLKPNPDFQVEVFDMLGHLVQSGRNRGEPLDFSSLPSGVYLVRFMEGGRLLHAQQIVKQ
jgi:hypothetical protein